MESCLRVNDPRFVLDSNILIYILDGDYLPLRRRLEAHPPGCLAVSSISCAEVLRGINPTDIQREERAKRLFDFFPVLPFDRAASEAYRLIPFRRGRFDSLIAAHALALGVTLITNNERDFADIPGLTVENWTR